MLRRKQVLPNDMATDPLRPWGASGSSTMLRRENIPAKTLITPMTRTATAVFFMQHLLQ